MKVVIFSFLAVLLYLIGAKSTNVETSITAPNSRIVGGKSKDIAEYPFIVSIRLLGFGYCSGSLYTPNAVITGAHCVFLPPSATKVYVGSSYRYFGNGMLYSVKDIKIHEWYESGEVTYDIAIVFLKRNTKVTTFVELPTYNDLPPQGTPATVCGWGLKSYKYPIYAFKLRCVDLTISHHNKCKKYDPLLPMEIICVNERGKGFSLNDCGGPLLADDKKTILGIANHMYSSSSPGFYINVVAFVQWILATVQTYNQKIQTKVSVDE